MATVIYLTGKQEPPVSGNCVVVSRDATGRHFVFSFGTGYRRAASPLAFEIAGTDLDETIERAVAHADGHSIPRVYVVTR
jgi:hypothetical protein